MTYLADRILDLGLAALIAEGSRADICSSEPGTFGAIATLSRGNATPVYSAISDAVAGGRQVVMAAAGPATSGGSVAFWAISDPANNRLLATGLLSSTFLVAVGGTFSIASIPIVKFGVVNPGYFAPVISIPPEITGIATVGEVLTCSDGLWGGLPDPTITKMWQRFGVIWDNLSDTDDNYTPVTADGGRDIRCLVTGTNEIDSNEFPSNIVSISPISDIAPVVGALDNRIYNEDTGKRYYNVANLSELGTPPTTWSMDVKVFKVDIIDNGDGTYSRKALTAGYPEPTHATQWKLGGAAISGQVGDTIDADTLNLDGSLTVTVTSTNPDGTSNLTSAAVVVDYGVASLVSPVHLGTTVTYKLGGSFNQPVPTPAYSIGDMVTVGVIRDSGNNIGSIASVVAIDGEPMATEITRFDFGAIGVGGVSMALYRYIAEADRGVGNNVTINMTDSDQLVASCSIWQGGTFASTSPITNEATGGSGATGTANAASPATIAPVVGSLPVAWVGADTVNVNAAPSGWTSRGSVTGGAVNGMVATRNALSATVNEAVVAGTYPLSGTEQWVAITAVINPFTG